MKNIASLLRTWDEYNKLSFAVPYVYQITKEGKSLTYFGTRHTYDPAEPGLDRLENEWNAFLEREGTTKVAIGEGSRMRPLRSTREEAILESGEQGLLRLLAHTANIELYYPDPERQRVWEALVEEGYSLDELFYHDAAEIANQWGRTDKSAPFEEYYQPFLERLRDYRPEAEYDFSMEHLRELHSAFFGSAFDTGDTRHFYDLIDPSNFTSRFNELSRAIDVVRDTAIVSKILECWEAGNSIFVLMGSGHAVIQEPALKTLLT